MKNTCIEIPILNDEYKVVVVWGDKKYVEKIGKQYGYDQDVVRLLDGNRGVTWRHAGKHPIIVLSRYPETPVELGTLAHEASHAVYDILEFIGASIDEEILGHSIGAIVRTVLIKGKQNKKKDS